MIFFEEGVEVGVIPFNAIPKGGGGGGEMIITNYMGEKVRFIIGEQIGYCNINFLYDMSLE